MHPTNDRRHINPSRHLPARHKSTKEKFEEQPNREWENVSLPRNHKWQVEFTSIPLEFKLRKAKDLTSCLFGANY